MRKLKLQVQTSIDGYISGANGEMDWMVWNWDEELKKYVIGITDTVDCILLGRKLAEGFIPHWAEAAKKTDDPEAPFAQKMSETQKIVFSKTVQRSDWSNTVVASGNLVEEITALKNQLGNDIIAYGGGMFVSSLIKNNLIDEYHLFVNPCILGSGMTIFGGPEQRLNLTLSTTRSFDCGIAVLCYQRTNAEQK
jgi:dihydrofolate reductase